MHPRPTDPAAGDPAAQGPSTARLMVQVMHELRALAAVYLRDERKGHSLQPTDLVHEAYLKLAENRSGSWRSRTHFFAVAASAVRHVLVDNARSFRSRKRGSGLRRLTLSGDLDGVREAGSEVDILELEEVLQELLHLDPRQHRVIELRFFGGLDMDEIAQVLEVSPRTVKRLWRAARAHLIVRLQEVEPA